MKMESKSVRLVRVKGKKRVVVAVVRNIIVIAYHLLKPRKSYEDLGGDYFDRQNAGLQRSRLIKKLEALGLKVTVEVVESAAWRSSRNFHRRALNCSLLNREGYKLSHSFRGKE